MQHITWYRLLAVGALAAPMVSRAQAPQPKVRQIATMPGVAVDEFVRLPNGKVVLYTVGDSIIAYDLATKHGTLVTRGFRYDLAVSRSGDRIAFCRDSETGDNFIWSMPINPRTGTPAGPAQRVSMSRGDSPTLSPDGKLIAFAADRKGHGKPSPGQGQDLAVVPAIGGAERILAEYPGKVLSWGPWSDDGKWIYLEVGLNVDPARSFERVPVAGGRAEPLTAFSQSGGRARGEIAGQIAFYLPHVDGQGRGRIAYVTASGVRGEFSIPLGSDGRVGSAHSLLRKTTRPSTAYSLNLAKGSVRDLLPGAVLGRSPVWSPDGRRLALQDSAGGHYEITVMNADGSQPRKYPVAFWDRTNWGFMQWSSNSQMLAYYAGAAQTAIAVLDVAMGNTRIVSSSPNGTGMAFIWRPDGKSIVVLKQSMASPEPHVALYEARLDGTERMLRDISAEFPGGRVTPRAFISDRLMIVGNASEQFAVPTTGGPPRQLPGGTSLRFPRPGVSPGPSREAKWILWLAQNTNRPITSVELMTSGGDSLRMLNLPFEVDPQVFHDSFYHPDGRHVILVGKTPGESATKIFLVPLNGGAPRVLAQLSGRLIGRFDVSPDGNTLAYTVEGAPTSTIYELDVSPILQTIGKH